MFFETPNGTCAHILEIRQQETIGQLQIDTTSFVGTEEYIAPEVRLRVSPVIAPAWRASGLGSDYCGAAASLAVPRLAALPFPWPFGCGPLWLQFISLGLPLSRRECGRAEAEAGRAELARDGQVTGDAMLLAGDPGDDAVVGRRLVDLRRADLRDGGTPPPPSRRRRCRRLNRGRSNLSGEGGGGLQASGLGAGGGFLP
jgi:hypothetical protein